MSLVLGKLWKGRTNLFALIKHNQALQHTTRILKYAPMGNSDTFQLYKLTRDMFYAEDLLYLATWVKSFASG
jgi:hypothetical protein